MTLNSPLPRQSSLETMLDSLACSVGWRCEGSPLFGWHQKSVGKKAVRAHGETAWMKLLFNPSEKEREGELRAGGMALSFKPNLLFSYPFENSLLLIMDYIEEPVWGAAPWRLRNPQAVCPSFLYALKKNLSLLHRTPTQRVHSRFDLVKRRVFERWDITLDERECQWETVHGDLHWANVTENYILDWESWGRGLLGLDEATLMAFSGLYPEVVEILFATLCTERPARPFALASLFITAELLRMHELYGDHPELVPSLILLGESSKDLWVS